MFDTTALTGVERGTSASTVWAGRLALRNARSIRHIEAVVNIRFLVPATAYFAIQAEVCQKEFNRVQMSFTWTNNSFFPNTADHFLEDKIQLGFLIFRSESERLLQIVKKCLV